MIALPDPIRQLERLREMNKVPALAPFEDHSTIQQLDALEVACRSSFFAKARAEALAESDTYPEWLAKLSDSAVTDSEVGRLAREIVLRYVQACAEKRDESLAEFIR